MVRQRRHQHHHHHRFHHQPYNQEHSRYRHCRDLTAIEVPTGARRIALVGNPNCGKSVLFNALTGMYVDVSNFPGTTVEVAVARLGKDVLIDTPGIYGVSSFNDEERVAREVILTADTVINVVDAVHLERDLFLTLQLIDLGCPMVVALNMMDEVIGHGLSIDVALLEERLGVPVVPTIAVRRQGLGELRAAIPLARRGKADESLETDLVAMLDRVESREEALLALEDDEDILKRHGLAKGGRREEIYLRRRERVNRLVEEVLSRNRPENPVDTLLGRLMVMPLSGVFILAGVLVAVYYLVGVFVAQTVVGITEETIMRGYYEPAVRALVGSLVPSTSPLGAVLIGEFGVLTMTATYVLGLLLPLVVGFYLVLSLMEDSGYLPRLATLVDRLLSSIGLNGRAVIPIILGFGCVTMATMTTRILGTQRERRIAIALLGITIPCSAQLGVITGLLAPLGPGAVAAYVAVILFVFILIGTLLARLLPGESSDLLIDLPPLRWPRIDNVIKKTATRSSMFIREATPLFAAGAFLIAVLQVAGFLEAFQSTLAPLTEGWLLLPREVATAFIMGFVRRDFGAAGLYHLPLTATQTLVALVVITLFVPCIASVMIIFKERGWREGVIVWLSALTTAFVVGGLFARLLTFFEGK